MEHGTHPSYCTSINLESPTFAGRGVIRSKTRGRTVSHRVSSLESQLEIAGKMSRAAALREIDALGRETTSQARLHSRRAGSPAL